METIALIPQKDTTAIEIVPRSADEEAVSVTAHLAAAIEELEALAYSVSHDLRAPLRAMDGFSQILLEDYGDVLPEEGRRVLGVIQKNTKKMGTLIDDLLDFSRLGRTELVKRVVDTRALAQEAIDDLMISAGRTIEIDLDELGSCSADPVLLKQVFVNLIGNAVKFTRDHDPAHIQVGGYESYEGFVCTVKDNGAGFDQRYADRMFGVFQRLHREDQFEGTGVGLALVERIVRRHGGRVWGEGAVDKGATFYFTLGRASP